MRQRFTGPPEISAYVDQDDPATGETAVFADGFDRPNGMRSRQTRR
ncbi:hypothetical protein [Rhodoplanes roseus]|nr:hypothetical protein [Rhodoplanes roseus]